VAKLSLRCIALVYLFFLLVLPVGVICYRTFDSGLASFWDALTSPDALHALQVTVVVAVPAVLLNTIFGVGTAILLVRHRFWGKSVLNALIDLPLAVSPVVAGLALVLVYGRFTPVGSWLYGHGIQVIYALPGMILATVFVSIPLVIRAVAPVIEEIGIEQEQAAWTLGATSWQAFRRVTLPAIRWALAYGVVLALARSLGEFGSVAVVSGNISGQTQTASLFVQDAFDNYNQQAAYAVAFVLAVMAVASLTLIQFLRPKESRQ
jgi:sulfate/thiosulfate transport system permease protein